MEATSNLLLILDNTRSGQSRLGALTTPGHKGVPRTFVQNSMNTKGRVPQHHVATQVGWRIYKELDTQAESEVKPRLHHCSTKLSVVPRKSQGKESRIYINVNKLM